MKKRAIKLLALTLVAIMTFFAVGCDMDAIFAPLSEILPEVPDGYESSNQYLPGETAILQNKETNVLDTPSVIPQVPVYDLDFEGETVCILVPDTKNVKQSWADEPDTILDEFVLMRNAAVSEELNIEIIFEYVAFPDFSTGSNNLTTLITNDIVADMHYYDVASASAQVIASAPLRDYFADFNNNDFDWMDLKNPCWNQTLINDCAINGRNYFVSGATEITSLLDTYVVWHNKTLYDEKKEAVDVESMKYLMLDGLWTYDELYRWALRLYEDSNGVPGQQIDDTYGLAIEGSGKFPGADAFPSTWDIQFTKKEDDGAIGLNKTSNSSFNERAETALTKVKSLYDATGAYINAEASLFTAGHYMFYMGKLNSLENVPKASDTIELLPMPKYDIEQDSYLSYTSNPILTAALNHEESTVPTKSDAISATLQLMAEESYNGIFRNLGDQVTIEIDNDDETTLLILFANMQLTIDEIYAPQLANINRIWSTALDSDVNISTVYAEKENIYKEAVTELNRWFGLID